MHQTIAHIRANAAALAADHATSDAIGRLTDAATAIVRGSGGIRLLQARDLGGFEEHPSVFFAWVREVARLNPSAGWIAGVVGVHPWEISLFDPKLQREIFGTDPDTWTASPYAPSGRAKRVDGGYLLSGEWSYSTGTDHCGWVILGGLVVGEDGVPEMPIAPRHFVLPRGDYEIVEDSWHVMGLSGTGSKNVRMTNSFVPEYRTVGHIAMQDGAYNHRRPGVPLYQLPFGCIFSAAISSALFGIARGTLDAYRDYLGTRVSALGIVGTQDPFQQQALAEAEADLDAGIVHLDVMVDRWLAEIAAGGTISPLQRLEFRRNQSRAAQRVIESIDRLLNRAGSAAVWTTRPIERYWRDLRTAGTHVCNVVDTTYTSWANAAFGTGVAPNTFY
jgi:alkylation response protein AidB-like acyl-CoA dehydrogenase